MIPQRPKLARYRKTAKTIVMIEAFVNPVLEGCIS